MNNEFKYSLPAMGLKVILVCIVSIVINLLILSGLLTIFEDNLAWYWFIQVLSLLVHFGLIFMFVSSDGRRDLLVDDANEKRAQRKEGLSFTKIYDIKKGFIAGAVANIPVVVLFIIWLASNKEASGIEIIVRLFFSPYFQMLNTFGLNILSALFFVILLTGITGASYYAATSHRKKVLTIIKRNEEKAKIKGIKTDSK